MLRTFMFFFYNLINKVEQRFLQIEQIYHYSNQSHRFVTEFDKKNLFCF